MPLYEYTCEKCGERFEVLRRASDTGDEECPSCGAPARKMISGFAIGSGSGGGGTVPSSSGGGGCFPGG